MDAQSLPVQSGAARRPLLRLWVRLIREFAGHVASRASFTRPPVRWSPSPRGDRAALEQDSPRALHEQAPPPAARGEPVRGLGSRLLGLAAAPPACHGALRAGSAMDRAPPPARSRVLATLLWLLSFPLQSGPECSPRGRRGQLSVGPPAGVKWDRSRPLCSGPGSGDFCSVWPWGEAGCVGRWPWARLLRGVGASYSGPPPARTRVTRHPRAHAPGQAGGSLCSRGPAEAGPLLRTWQRPRSPRAPLPRSQGWIWGVGC